MQWLYENPWPIYVLASLGALGAIIVWLQQRDLRLMFVALVCLLTGLAAWGIDASVITDREQLEALFPRLARAAEQGDVETLLAAIDPTLRPKQNEARLIMQQVKPTAVVINDLQLDVHSERQPPTATADLICRISGRVVGMGDGDSQLVGVHVVLRKHADQWLIVDFNGEQPDLFKKKPR